MPPFGCGAVPEVSPSISGGVKRWSGVTDIERLRRRTDDLKAELAALPPSTQADVSFADLMFPQFTELSEDSDEAEIEALEEQVNDWLSQKGLPRIARGLRLQAQLLAAEKELGDLEDQRRSTADFRSLAIEALDSAESLLRDQADSLPRDEDSDGTTDGWSKEFAIFLADRLAGCRADLEMGEPPWPSFGYEMFRHLELRISIEDQHESLSKAVSEAGAAVDRLRKATEAE